MIWYLLFAVAWIILMVAVVVWGLTPKQPRRHRCTCARRLRDLGVYDSDCPEHGIPALRRVA